MAKGVMVLEQTISLSYDRPNFTECDRCAPNLLRPHLIQEEENKPAFSKIQQLLTQFKQAFEHVGAIILAVDGQILFMTQRAEPLLSQYFLPYDPHSLPDPLDHWFKYQISQLTHSGNVPLFYFPLHMEQSGRQLIIRLIPDPIAEQYLLLLEERELPSFSVAALELLGLTKREAEVLFWIAKDKSNAGIAKVLGCCEGTVRKHLENLYKKLGVQTRMGAVMVTLEKLGLLKG
jgi:DNA-binding CsgD family transcriptional regulator